MLNMFCVDENNKSIYYNRYSTSSIYKITNVVSGTFTVTNTGLRHASYSQFLVYDDYIYNAYRGGI